MAIYSFCKLLFTFWQGKFLGKYDVTNWIADPQICILKKKNKNEKKIKKCAHFRSLPPAAQATLI
jgi:hypothetical protein